MTETEPGIREAAQAPSGRGMAQAHVLEALQIGRLPICLSDPNQPDAPIVYWNPAMEQLTGYSTQEMLGRNGRVLQGPGTDPRTVTTLRHKIAAVQDVHVEILNYRKDGSSFWASVFVSPVIDEAGRLQYYVGTLLDVSDRREADIARLQSLRLDIMGGMASKLAHEFNNLMTIVLANLERAVDGPDEARRARLISRARDGAQKAAALTDQMLSFARRQFHDDRIVQIDAVLNELAPELHLAVGDGVTIEVDPAGAFLLVRLDPRQLALALLALVRNAATACPSGGRVYIASRARPESNEVEIVVSDDGVGMTRDVALRATEPFFSTRDRGQGTGLGLSMVKGFTEQSGGRLDIHTTPEAGTRVRMVFPEAQQPAGLSEEGE